jgi:hypothetical protein
MSEFDDGKHPRDKDGKFADKGGGGETGSNEKSTKEKWADSRSQSPLARLKEEGAAGPAPAAGKPKTKKGADVKVGDIIGTHSGKGPKGEDLGYWFVRVVKVKKSPSGKKVSFTSIVKHSGAKVTSTYNIDKEFPLADKPSEYKK